MLLCASKHIGGESANEHYVLNKWIHLSASPLYGHYLSFQSSPWTLLPLSMAAANQLSEATCSASAPEEVCHHYHPACHRKSHGRRRYYPWWQMARNPWSATTVSGCSSTSSPNTPVPPLAWPLITPSSHCTGIES